MKMAQWNNKKNFTNSEIFVLFSGIYEKKSITNKK